MTARALQCARLRLKTSTRYSATPQPAPCTLANAGHQRTHVLTHAAGLVMHRILDPVSRGGMGYRRCQWTTTTRNDKSQAAARRLGYTPEGVLRGYKILAPGKEACRGESS